MLDTVLSEAERCDFPIIIVSNDIIYRNSKARGVRSLSHALPLSRLAGVERKRVLTMTENSLTAVSFKTKARTSALAYRYLGFLAFLYPPMLDNIADLPSEAYIISESANGLPELVSSLALKLLGAKIRASSLARIGSVAGALAFSEDVVATELDGDGDVCTEGAFFALAEAFSELDEKDASELSKPHISISFSENGLSLAVYGYETYRESSAVLSAVAPYSFTEKEYSAAFLIAVASAIFKGRK